MGFHRILEGVNLSRILIGVGTGITAFLLVAILVIELVQVDPGAGILGVGAGTLAGIVVFVVVVMLLGDASDFIRWGVASVAGFGWMALIVSFLSYANIAGLRSFITPRNTAVIAAGAAVAVYTGSWLYTRLHGYEM